MLALKREKESLEAHIEKLKGELETCECAPHSLAGHSLFQKTVRDHHWSISFGPFSQYSSCRIMP